MAADDGKEKNRQGNEEQGDPRTLDEFRNQYDGRCDAGDEGSSPLTRALFTQCGPRFFLQCTTMPACESVKARNAPTA